MANREVRQRSDPSHHRDSGTARIRDRKPTLLTPFSSAYPHQLRALKKFSRPSGSTRKRWDPSATDAKLVSKRASLPNPCSKNPAGRVPTF